MLITDSLDELRAQCTAWRGTGESVAFVPTMGNLHEGHLRLVEEARKQARRVVVSIFVNPLQFGPNEDFQAYPRTPEQDVQALLSVEADLLFQPSVDTVYPGTQSHATYVDVPVLSEQLCGAFRPGHFRGVLTVVCKLFNMVQPDAALFGEKDYQQLTLIRKMVNDLNIPVDIQAVPTVRERNGLAMSSRNAYLSDEEKQRASLLFCCLTETRRALLAGNSDFSNLEEQQLAFLRGNQFDPDYFAIRRADDLLVPTARDNDLVVLVAARLGKARLIDNLRVQLSRP